MRVYADSSALLKRVVDETESDLLVAALDRHVANHDLIVSSSLAWVEISRALLALADQSGDVVDEAIVVALSGVVERPIGQEIISLARRIRPSTLRTLDAIHLATALFVDADLVLTYDERLAAACEANALSVTSPGRSLRFPDVE